MDILEKYNCDKFQCIQLNWDTQYFDIECAKVILKKDISKEERKKIINFCSHYDFITIINKRFCYQNSEWIGNSGKSYLADVNIQFKKKVYKDMEFSNDYNGIEIDISNNYDYSNDIVKIAQKNFVYSRFFNDTNLNRDKALGIYTHWTKCAFNKYNKIFIVAKIKNEIAAYSIISLQEKNAVIELLVVDEKFAGRGIGKLLIKSIEEYLYDKKVEYINVGTQIENVEAIRLYNSMGFKYIDCNFIYHLWM